MNTNTYVITIIPKETENIDFVKGMLSGIDAVISAMLIGECEVYHGIARITIKCTAREHFVIMRYLTVGCKNSEISYTEVGA